MEKGLLIYNIVRVFKDFFKIKFNRYAKGLKKLPLGLTILFVALFAIKYFSADFLSYRGSNQLFLFLKTYYYNLLYLPTELIFSPFTYIVSDNLTNYPKINYLLAISNFVFFVLLFRGFWEYVIRSICLLPGSRIFRIVALKENESDLGKEFIDSQITKFEQKTGSDKRAEIRYWKQKYYNTYFFHPLVAWNHKIFDKKSYYNIHRYSDSKLLPLFFRMRLVGFILFLLFFLGPIIVLPIINWFMS